MARSPELSPWITLETSEASIDRVWERVEQAAARSRRRRVLVPVLAGSAVLVALGVGAVLQGTRARPLTPGVELLAEEQPVRGRFSDGSTVELSGASAVRLLGDTPGEMRVGLARGAATFDVAKRPSRRFVIEAGIAEVRVIGTRFTVYRDEGRVQVSVQRGIVEVVQDGQVARITAGGTWQSRERREGVTPGRVPAVVAAPRASAERAAVVRHPSAALLPSKSVARESAPEELFEGALAARREGRMEDAALGLEHLLRRYPSDSRAALAAFELGRLQMDALKDERSAAESLTLSLQLSPDAPFAEEALARLVRAYDGLGATASCLHSRDRYLAQYPDGAYGASVGSRCR